MLRVLLLACLFVPGLGFAGVQDVIDAKGSGKFKVAGTVLSYDSDQSKDPDDQELSNTDVDELLLILRASPEITTLELTSSGGSVWAGNEMARIVMDFELDTQVSGECSSSCITVFLAGAKRSLTRGSKLGFHQRSWSSSAVQSYYERWREDEGWETPFDFGSWIYKDTQTEIHKELTYMVERGVDAAFAIKTKQLRSSMWFPSRIEMTQAGVLRD